MIKLKNITKEYPKGNCVALSDVSFDVPKGDFVSIVGQSGAGKSTVVRLLIGEEKPDSGEIEVNDWDVRKISRRKLPKYRREIGVVFQDFKLLQKKTAYENIAFAMEACALPSKRIHEDVPRALKMVGLWNKAELYPMQLSGGEKQRVAIARALIHKPKLLIADEPTGNLDSINAWEIAQLLAKINSHGTTVLIATHNREIVNALKKKVITLDNGRVIKIQEKGQYLL